MFHSPQSSHVVGNNARNAHLDPPILFERQLSTGMSGIPQTQHTLHYHCKIPRDHLRPNFSVFLVAGKDWWLDFIPLCRGNILSSQLLPHEMGWFDENSTCQRMHFVFLQSFHCRVSLTLSKQARFPHSPGSNSKSGEHWQRSESVQCAGKERARWSWKKFRSLRSLRDLT